MASTYTTNTGLEKPATGEQSGTWGDTTNTNFDLIDRLTHGVGTISLSGTTHTLTTSDGALSEGQYVALVLGGSPSGTNTITISPNDQTKLFVVKNGSGQDAIFTQGSGGNVTVSNGTSKIIYCDGAGSGAEVVDVTNTIDMAGVVNATTFKIDGTEVTATAAELNILDGVTASAAEINILDGVTATTAEINYVDGVTSNIQTQIDNIVTMPSGSVTAYAGSSAPSGWLLCYGQAVSRSTYSDLFSAIGTTYGVGDGATTFNLPDARGRAIAGQDDMGGTSADRLTGLSGGVDGDVLGGTGGSETHTLTEAELASHRHLLAYGVTQTDSVPYPTPTSSNQMAQGVGGSSHVSEYSLYPVNDEPNVLRSSATGSGSAHNNVQPTLILNYIIKT